MDRFQILCLSAVAAGLVLRLYEFLAMARDTALCERCGFAPARRRMSTALCSSPKATKDTATMVRGV